MSTKLSKSINNSIYPKIFSSFPRLIRLLHFITFISTLRNWYCRKSILSVIQQRNSSINVFDAGCGAGDFLIPLLKKFPGNRYFGIDISLGHISACINYLKSSNIENCTFKKADLELFKFAFSPDIIFCITVLQYIDDDVKVLNSFYENLSPGGLLILYVPVNYKHYFKFYPVIKRYFSSSDYDNNLGLKRQYSPDEITRKVENSGFIIRRKIFAYGPFGKIAYELHSAFLLFIFSSPVYCAVIVSILYFLFIFPFTLLFNLVDFYSINRNGNGVLIVAEKGQK